MLVASIFGSVGFPAGDDPFDGLETLELLSPPLAVNLIRLEVFARGVGRRLDLNARCVDGPDVVLDPLPALESLEIG